MNKDIFEVKLAAMMLAIMCLFLTISVKALKTEVNEINKKINKIEIGEIIEN